MILLGSYCVSLFKSLLYWISVVVLIGQLTACATLSKSECQVANWEIIGLKDGANGRAPSYISEHQSACSKHGVKADLNTYLLGHAKGVKQYCTYDKGYSLAADGNRYNNNCVANQFPEFQKGYVKGQRAYEYIAEINNLRSRISSYENRLVIIERDILTKEDLLLAKNTNLQLKRDLLEEIKFLNTEMTEIRNELPYLESDLLNAERRYESFRRQR